MSEKAASQPLDADKAALRKEMYARRRKAFVEGEKAGNALKLKFLEAVSPPEGARVSGFWPMGSEIDPRPLLEVLSARGHPIGLPVVTAPATPLTFRAWKPGDILKPGGFNTEVPDADKPEIEPDILLVPLLAFDRQGFRLGYGGGFYDRTLSALRETGARLAVGVAFAAQEVEAVPRGDYDQSLDMILTDREVIYSAG
jgi:5-formyltetrahydrofolate cyclo-ligase